VHQLPTGFIWFFPARPHLGEQCLSAEFARLIADRRPAVDAGGQHGDLGTDSSPLYDEQQAMTASHRSPEARLLSPRNYAHRLPLQLFVSFDTGTNPSHSPGVRMGPGETAAFKCIGAADLVDDAVPASALPFGREVALQFSFFDSYS